MQVILSKHRETKNEIECVMSDSIFLILTGKVFLSDDYYAFLRNMQKGFFIMNNKDLQLIQDQIGYSFKNSDLLQQAFVRRSYAQENGGEDNEVLEFIGDKVLDFVVVKLLAEKYGYFLSACDDFDPDEEFDEFACDYKENKLTEMKKKLVEKTMLAHCIDMLDLADFLIMGKGDRNNHVEREASVKEDLFEAIIGAVTLDSGWNIDEMQSVVEYMLQPETYLCESEDDNYVAMIQDWSLRQSGQLPNICTTGSSYDEETSPWLRNGNEIRSTPKRDHTAWFINVQEYPKTHFCSRMTLPNVNQVFKGYGRSKNEARKDVCKLAYRYLDENDMLFTIRDEIDNPNRDMAINQLEILARRGYFSLPTYTFKETYDDNGNPVWNCECHIEEEEYYFDEISSSKKAAKKGAAYSMLMYVLGMEE